MPTPKPWEFHPELTERRLATIAKALLDVYYDVESDLSTDLDTAYTRGTTTFGRQKSKIIQMCTSGEFNWLDLRNTSNDVVFAVGSVPFRFFSDDHEKPKKPGFWRRNPQDNLFPTTDNEPVFWRFIVEKPLSDEAEASVYVIGANFQQETVCEWKYDELVRVLTSTDETRPEPVDTPEPEIGLPEEEQNNQKGGRRGTGS